MKVISGRLKGRKLFFLKDKNIRPTKDIVREAVFDVLRGCIENESVLDLFAGTGALGIEAFSQGAREIVFVESDYEACRIIKENVDFLAISGACTIVRSSVEKAVENFKNAGFGLVLADPPYGYSGKRISDILSAIVRLGVIRKGGIIVVEHERQNKIPVFEEITMYKEKKYGKSQVSYFLVL